MAAVNGINNCKHDSMNTAPLEPAGQELGLVHNSPTKEARDTASARIAENDRTPQEARIQVQPLTDLSALPSRARARDAMVHAQLQFIASFPPAAQGDLHVQVAMARSTPAPRSRHKVAPLLTNQLPLCVQHAVLPHHSARHRKRSRRTALVSRDGHQNQRVRDKEDGDVRALHVRLDSDGHRPTAYDTSAPPLHAQQTLAWTNSWQVSGSGSVPKTNMEPSNRLVLRLASSSLPSGEQLKYHDRACAVANDCKCCSGITSNVRTSWFVNSLQKSAEVRHAFMTKAQKHASQQHHGLLVNKGSESLHCRKQQCRKWTCDGMLLPITIDCQFDCKKSTFGNYSR